MKKSYVLSIEVLPDGGVQAKETFSGLTVPEIIGLLEMQKHNVLAKLQTTSLSMPGGINGKQQQE